MSFEKNITKDEVLKMALEGAANYIDVLGGDSRKYRQVLAQPEQEPVAWATKDNFYRALEHELKHIREEMKIKTVTMRCKDYAVDLPIISTDFGRVLVGQVFTPPQRTWVGLTDDEIWEAYMKAPLTLDCSTDELYALARTVEAKLKEKNK